MNAPTLPEWSPTQRERCAHAARRAVGYLCDRQSTNGGFCFYRWLGIDEPNLHDTWHAVAALTLLGAAVPRSDAVAASLAAYLVGTPEALYQRTFTLERLGRAATLAPADLQRIRALDPARALAGNVPITARFETILRMTCLRLRFAAAPVRSPAVVGYVRGECHADGGWGDKPNLSDTALALAALDLLGGPTTSAATRAFVDGLQAPAFGFAATPDSLFADLDTVYAGVVACARLRLPVRHPQDVMDYVLACQDSNGGFARTPDALPDIARTHRALDALGRIGALDVHSADATPLVATL